MTTTLRLMKRESIMKKLKKKRRNSKMLFLLHLSRRKGWLRRDKKTRFLKMSLITHLPSKYKER
jgi:hypothetical protein